MIIAAAASIDPSFTYDSIQPVGRRVVFVSFFAAKSASFDLILSSPPPPSLYGIIASSLDDDDDGDESFYVQYDNSASHVGLVGAREEITTGITKCVT